jgi:hypothetical protein
MKIQLPIASAALTFIAIMPSEPVLDHQSKQQKARRKGGIEIGNGAARRESPR